MSRPRNPGPSSDEARGSERTRSAGARRKGGTAVMLTGQNLCVRGDGITTRVPIGGAPTRRPNGGRGTDPATRVRPIPSARPMRCPHVSRCHPARRLCPRRAIRKGRPGQARSTRRVPGTAVGGGRRGLRSPVRSRSDTGGFVADSGPVRTSGSGGQRRPRRASAVDRIVPESVGSGLAVGGRSGRRVRVATEPATVKRGGREPAGPTSTVVEGSIGVDSAVLTHKLQIPGASCGMIPE